MRGGVGEEGGGRGICLVNSLADVAAAHHAYRAALDIAPKNTRVILGCLFFKIGGWFGCVGIREGGGGG